MKELKKTGPKPEKSKDQVTWLTDLMVNLQRLLQLGGQIEELAREVFFREVFSNILDLFPEKEHLKLFKERMGNLLKRLEEKREDANRLDKERGEKGKNKGAGEGLE